MTRRTASPLVIVGDALLDRDLDGEVRRLCPDAPAPVLDDPSERVRPGGAALAALLAARAGHDVVLVTALGDDEAGHGLRRRLDGLVELVPLSWSGATAGRCCSATQAPFTPPRRRSPSGTPAARGTSSPAPSPPPCGAAR